MRNRILVLNLVGLLLTSNWVSAAPPDLIVTHGKVVTVDPKFSIAEAFAVHEGRIVAVGKNEEILALAGDKTQKLNLGGKTVIPGLCDSHVHPSGAASYEFDHPIPEMDTIGDVLKYVAARADVLPDGEWISLSQVFITRLRDQRYPNRKELDAAAPKNPVIFQTGPDASCNSLALKLSGIDKNFQITDGKSGQIEKDPVTGELTGILRNASRFVKYKSSAKSASVEERRAGLKKLLADYNSVGLTSLADRNASDGAVADYLHLKEKGELSCRVFVSYAVNGNADKPEIEKRLLAAANHPLHKYDS
ncbi:MAG: Exoenzyme regulatory protein AepA precursor, partial [Planctomycetaceae bacterium]|nr:Exoenzyme regulatory protein AepA precursor [Planctomycetaceae bacterium]